MPAVTNPGTGLGGVITAFGFNNFVLASWKFTSITGYEEVVAEIDDTHLGSDVFEETIPASLASLPAITATVQWRYDEVASFGQSALPLTVGDIQTVTIAFPDRANLSGGSVSGTAFITSIKSPDNTVGDRSLGSITFKYDGKTGPTYTAHL